MPFHTNATWHQLDFIIFRSQCKMTHRTVHHRSTCENRIKNIFNHMYTYCYYTTVQPLDMCNYQSVYINSLVWDLETHRFILLLLLHCLIDAFVQSLTLKVWLVFKRSFWIIHKNIIKFCSVPATFSWCLENMEGRWIFWGSSFNLIEYLQEFQRETNMEDRCSIKNDVTEVKTL